MRRRDVIVVGGSAGASDSLRVILARMPADLAAAIFVVLHVEPTGGDLLAGNLARHSPFNVQLVRREMPIEHGTVYLPTSDHHLLIKEDYVTVTHGPHENYWRPAIDVLFRSAAVACGPRVIAVLLSGDLDDGTMGLIAVKRCGGLTVIQDPSQTSDNSMLETAARHAVIDHVVAVDALPARLASLTRELAPAAPEIPSSLIDEVSYADSRGGRTPRHAPLDEPPSALSCPECGGPLWESSVEPLAFRCLVGHAFAAGSLLHGSGLEMERTLWAAVRLFEQRTHLEGRMAEEAARRGRAVRADIYKERSRASAEHAANLRKLLEATRNEY